MKTAIAVAAAAFATGSLALPVNETELVRRADPSFVPVTVYDAPDNLPTYRCGDTDYEWSDVYDAIAWGTILRDAGQTRGKYSYPHTYGNSEDLAFPDNCKGKNDDRLEFPIKQGTYYNGGKNNKQQGDERAVFIHVKGHTDPVENHPDATFCGVMTHQGASKGSFVLCEQL